MKALIINTSPVRTGATAEIVKKIASCLTSIYDVRMICIDDFTFDFCTGCRTCHNTARCILPDDGIAEIISELEWADKIVTVSPSYWADIPGQFKAFIDRCTPWCNTHDPHATISPGKKGYSVALRTGPGMRECNRIIESIEHFYSHMEISVCENMGLYSVENKTDVQNRTAEIEAFCEKIKGE